MRSLSKKIRRLFAEIRLSDALWILFGSFLLAFGLYNVHARSGVTEGGVLGLTLLLDRAFGLSPSVTGFLLNLSCYALGFQILGRRFLLCSALASGGFSLSYGILEQFEPLLPSLESHPLGAALLGALFVGLGAGISVRAGGAPSGDDALAMGLSERFGWGIQWIYLLSDLSVLLLSLSYIPLRRILYSLLTVILSGQIVGWVVKIPARPFRRLRQQRAEG